MAAGHLPRSVKPSTIEALPSHVCVLAPELVHAVKLAMFGDTSVFLHPLELSKRSLILCPINDSDAPYTPGGTHWSLLVIRRHVYLQMSLENHYDLVTSV
jgi:hypothetical protein